MNELIIVCPNCGYEMSIGGICTCCGTKDYTEITNKITNINTNHTSIECLMRQSSSNLFACVNK